MLDNSCWITCLFFNIMFTGDSIHSNVKHQLPEPLPVLLGLHVNSKKNPTAFFFVNLCPLPPLYNLITAIRAVNFFFFEVSSFVLQCCYVTLS